MHQIIILQSDSVILLKCTRLVQDVRHFAGMSQIVNEAEPVNIPAHAFMVDISFCRLTHNLYKQGLTCITTFNGTDGIVIKTVTAPVKLLSIHGQQHIIVFANL
jgi:hypothetical protein